jgi:hypothetical protein
MRARWRAAPHTSRVSRASRASKGLSGASRETGESKDHVTLVRNRCFSACRSIAS